MSSTTTGTIQFSGLGSGIDTASMIEKLISAERSADDTRISKATTSASAKISAISTLTSAFTSLQSALSTLRSSDTSNARSTTVGTGAGFTATASAGAAAGTYSIQVVQLASAEKQMSGLKSSGATPGSDGTLSFSAGETQFDISVSSTDTLSSVAASINKAAAGKGLSATVINVDGGQQLVLTAADTGTAGAITIDGDSTLKSWLGMTKTDATDAKVTIDGQTRTSSSNTLTDLLDNVTLKLTAVDTEAHSLGVSTNTGTISAAVASLVTSYNAALNALKSTSAFTPGTKGESGSSSALTGDSMVRTLQQQLRTLIGNNVTDLKELGVTIAKDGILSLDTSKLSSALTENPSAVSNVFDGDTGLGEDLSTLLDGALDSTNGLFKLRNDSLSKTLNDLSDQSDRLDKRMEQLKAVYTAQFSAMETIVTQMNSTSTYLTQQLSSLSKQLSSS